MRGRNKRRLLAYICNQLGIIKRQESSILKGSDLTLSSIEGVLETIRLEVEDLNIVDWIRVEEELPRQGEPVIVTFRVPDVENTFAASIGAMDHRDNWKIHGLDTLDTIDVVAWMPFPKVYREEKDMRITS